MKRFVVFDTNVIVSAFLAKERKLQNNQTAFILSSLLNPKSKSTVIYNDEIIDEYKEVLLL